ncbi:hypothetical protein OG21DRAFT_1267504 [Imleria badia]|nr:hypothetical protein OG21DRAFT_1267504 [Imleria badia]
MPVGFHVLVQLDGTKRRTENKPVYLHDDVVEWDDGIQLPSEPSAKVQLSVCASFEFSPMLGNGEILRTVDICVGDLLDNTHVVMFSPTQGEPISPCSSFLITTERRRSHKSDTASDHDDDFDWEEPSDLAQLTDQGHDALLRYRDDPRKESVAVSIGYFKHALLICPSDHRCHAVALCNLARVYFIKCQIDRESVGLMTSISYYREALGLRRVGHPDRPGTLLHLAEVLVYRYGKVGYEEFPGEIVELASEVQASCSEDSHERRAVDLALQTYALHKAIRSSSLADNDRLILGLRQAVRDIPDDYFDKPQRLTNLALALWIRREVCGNLENLDESIATHEVAMQFIPCGLDPPTHTQLLKEQANATSAGSSWKVALITAASLVVPRFSIYRALCERLEALGRVTDAIQCFPQMVDELGEETNLHGENLEWFLDFRYRYSEMLERFGDVAMDSQRHDEALKYYLVVLPIHPTNTQRCFIIRSKVCMANGLWEDALDHADESITFDPTSPWGYKTKHAALHGAGRYKDARQTFETMLSKMAQSPDPQIRCEFVRNALRVFTADS